MAILQLGNIELNRGAKGEQGLGGATVVLKDTDNISDSTEWTLLPADAVNDVGHWAIEFPTNGATHLTMFDDFPTESYDEAGKPQVVEYDISDVVIATQFSGATGLKWKVWELNPLTTKVKLTFPEAIAPVLSGVTPAIIKEKVRVTLGEYFTTDVEIQEIDTIGGFEFPKKDKPLKELKIAGFGDSMISDEGEIGTAGSFLDKFWKEHECIVRNYGKGSAGLTDWDDTSVVTDGSESGHDNVVSNQLAFFATDSFIPDVAILHAGTNDAFRSRVAGNLTTAISNYSTPASQNREEIYGMLFYFIRTLEVINPDVKIIICRPPKGVELAGFENFNTNLAPILTNIDTVADTLGVYTVDFNNLLNNIDETLPSKDYQDELHISRYAKDEKVFPKLNELIKNII